MRSTNLLVSARHARKNGKQHRTSRSKTQIQVNQSTNLNLIHRSFNDISMEQLKLSGSNMATVQAKMKNVMMIGAKINQVDTLNPEISLRLFFLH